MRKPAHLRTAVAALPLLLGALCGFSVCAGWTWGGRLSVDDIRLALRYELILIHAAPFLMAAIVAQPKTWPGRIGRAACFWGMCALYTWTGYREGGHTGALTVWGLGLATYAGVFFKLGVADLREIGQRWLLAIATLFFGICAPIGVWVTMVQGRPAPSFDDIPVVLPVLFLLLGLYELFDVYSRLWTPVRGSISPSTRTTPETEAPERETVESGGNRPK